MRLRRLLLTGVLVAVTLGLAGAGGAAQGKAHWVITDLGVPFGKWIEPVAINNRGQAIFSSRSANNRHRYAFLWANGRVSDLGELDNNRIETLPAAINERGQIVGSSGNSPWGGGSDHAFLWEKGRMRDLGVVGQDTASGANDINDRGQIIGGSSGSSPGSHAFLWQSGKMIDIGTCVWHGKTMTARAINNLGQIVGYCSVPGRHLHAFIWANGKITDLGTLGGVRSYAQGINDRGQVVGTSRSTDKRDHAFLWEDGKMTDLGLGTGDAVNALGEVIISGGRIWKNGTVFNVEANAINDLGQVTGEDEVVPPGKDEEQAGRTIPFVWENGHKTALPTLGGQWTWTDAINNRGQIIGTSETKSGQTHAVLWTLRTSS